MKIFDCSSNTCVRFDNLLFCSGKTEKEMNNLRQEIEILKGLYHENIILLLDSFETSHEFCVVTEFAQGELFEILEDDRNLGEAEVRKIAQ
jgi:fused